MRKFVLQSILILFLNLAVIRTEHISSCGKSNLTDVLGTIHSPHYPNPFNSQVQCEWVIQCPKQSILKIEILDLDLDSDCSQHWLAVPFEGGRGYNILCGQKFSSHPITVVQPLTSIKYFSSELIKENRGFSLKYTIEELKCDDYDLHCQSGGCVSNTTRCDGIKDCQDASDELGCPPGPWCPSGTLSCPSAPRHCYSINEEICNGKLFCPHGEDELSCSSQCPGRIACFSGDGCYDPGQRCNGIRNCRDNSDETCPTMVCGPLELVCRTGGCAPAASICDGIADCEDSSDEEHCSKSSLLLACLLACACLSCVALSLIYRFYSTRFSSAAFLEHLRPEEDADETFIYREPPPSYAVAIADVHPVPRPESSRAPRRHRHRQRRPRSERGAASVACGKTSFPASIEPQLLYPLTSDSSCRDTAPHVPTTIDIDDVLLLP